MRVRERERPMIPLLLSIRFIYSKGKDTVQRENLNNRKRKKTRQCSRSVHSPLSAEDVVGLLLYEEVPRGHPLFGGGQ